MDVKGEVMAELRAMLPYLRREFGVRTLALFGSVVRSEASPTSDVDLLVTFETTPGLLRMMTLEQFIADVLGRPVDLVTRAGLKPSIGDRVVAEAQEIL